MKNIVGHKLFTGILFAVMLVSLSSCRRYDVDAILLDRDDISLTIKGDLCLAFEPMTCQLGYNDSRNEFRVYDDLIGNMFVITCSKSPDTEGMSLKADILYTASSSTKTMNALEFNVRRISSDGRIWMWNDSKKIGVVVKILK